MFNRNYFSARSFAPVYFPPVPSDDEEVISGGRRVWGNPIAMPNLSQHSVSNPNISIGGMAKGRVKRG